LTVYNINTNPCYFKSVWNSIALRLSLNEVGFVVRLKNEVIALTVVESTVQRS
jgi:hypothetical protein